MKTLAQKVIITHTDGSKEETERVHLYAETGRLIDSRGRAAGIHIELGTGASAAEYAEEPGTESREIPEILPEIEIIETEDEPTDAEYIEAAKILLGRASVSEATEATETTEGSNSEGGQE